MIRYLPSFVFLIIFSLFNNLEPAILILVPRPTYLGKERSLETVNNFLVNWGKFFVRNRVPFLSILFVGMFLFSFGI